MIIRLRAIDVSTRGAIIELTSLNMGHVSETIPLGAALRVQRVGVIVCEARE